MRHALAKSTYANSRLGLEKIVEDSVFPHGETSIDL